ncbi:MAG: phosphate-starvation-inducible PsiE family protein [Chloroflexi bacterium]|nr:phosphate-starvation-inducible PsiE family protein [Chloroflexota bacterium]
MSEERREISAPVRFLRSAESVVLGLIALVLVALALVLLGESVISMANAVMQGEVLNLGVEILDSVLLVMMIMEIVYTVTLSLESHTLIAEPFLIIGTIAAIRRMLVITATSTRLETSNPDAFRSTLIELGLLAMTVVAMAVSIYILRRTAAIRTVKEESEK